METHKIEIKPVNPEEQMTGFNCQILLNGKPLDGVTRIEFSVAVGEPALVTLSMFANVEVEGLVAVERVNEEVTVKNVKGETWKIK